MNGAYSFKPYDQDEEWMVWVCVAPLMSIYPLFYDGEATLFQSIGYVFGCLLFWFGAVIGIMEHYTKITVSDQGIFVGRGKRVVVPATKWNAFACAYLVDLSWTDRDKIGFRYKRYASYYFIFVKNPLTDAEINKLTSRLVKAKPLGEWKGHIAFRSNEQHNSAIQQCIGEQLPLIALKKNSEGEICRV